MATPTLTTDLVTVAVGNGDAGTWDGGKSNLDDPVTYIEGDGSQQFIANSAGAAIIYYQPPSSISIGTSSVLRIWAMITDAFRADLKVNGGITVWATNGSDAQWYYHGNDTLNTLWTQFVVDTGTTPSVGSNPFGSNITQMGIELLFTSLGKNTPTIWVDAIRYGNLISAYGGTSGDEIDIEGIFLLDDAQKYGILMKSLETGAYSIRGHITVGDSVGTSSTYFLTEGKVLIAEAFDWGADDMLQLSFVGNGTGTTDIKLLGCFVNATADYMTINTTDTNITNLTFSGNTFGNIYGLTLQSGHIVKNNVFSKCYRVDPQGSTFESNTFANCTDTLGAMIWNTTTTNTKSCAFNDCTLGVYIPATVTGSITFDAMTFSGNTVDVYWAGTAGELVINATNGTNITTTDSAGGTITVNAGKIFSFTTSPALTGYEWRIYYVTALGSLDGAVEVEGEESATAGSKSHSYNYVSDQPIAVQIINQPTNDYVESITYYTLGNADQSVTILLQKDDNN